MKKLNLNRIDLCEMCTFYILVKFWKKKPDEADKPSEIDSIVDLLNQGIKLDEQGKYEEAITCYDKALKIDPDYVFAFNNKGSALDELGRHEEAIACYDAVLEMKPDVIHALHNKGRALAKLGKYDDAITWYNKALEIDPDDVIVLNNKKRALDKLNKPEEITPDDKALEIKDEEQYENMDDDGIPIPYISDDLQTIIKINYDEKKKAKSRIFVSKKQASKPDSSPLEQDRAKFKSEQIKGKDVTGYVGENWVRFKMDVKKFRTSRARWVYGGNYEIGTDDLPGYSLIVTFGSDEKTFKSLVIQALQKNGFGCMVGNTSASCHLREEYPTEEKAKQVLENICKSVNSELYV